MSEPNHTDTKTDTVVAGLDRPLVAFFALAYALAWGSFGIVAIVADQSGSVGTIELFSRAEVLDVDGLDLAVPGIVLYLLTRVADFSFSIAGVVLLWWIAGRDGLVELWARLTRVQFPLRWYLFASLPIVLYALAAAVAGLSDSSVFGTVDLSPAAWRAVLLALDGGLLVTLFLRGPLGEELGLRGFALPRLQARTNPFHASLVIGVLWGFWHLPVLLGRDALIIVLFLLLAIGLSFLFTWLFNGTRGSLVGVLVFHTFQNSEEAFEVLLPGLVGTDWELVSTITLLAIGLAVGVLLWRRHRSPRAA